MDGVEAGQHARDNRVAGFVIGDRLALAHAHDTLFLEPRDEAIDGVVEVAHLDRFLVLARGEQGSLVDEVGEVGARESSRPLCDHAQVDSRRHLHLARVDAENLFAAAHVGLVDEHLAIEAAGTEQRRVEHLGAVGRAHDDDPLARIEPVHLREQLVQRLFTLFVASHRALHADLSERVELVDEHDARRLEFGLGEQIAHARRAHAHEHLDELGTAQAEEGDLRFAGDRFGEQRFTGAWRADQQHALRNVAADVGVLLRVLEKLDDLHQLFLGLVDAGDIAEPHLHIVFGVDLRLAARERHHPPLGAAHLPEKEAPERDEEQQGNDPAQELRQPAVHQLAGVLDAALLELGDERRVLDTRRDKRLGLAVGVVGLQRTANDLLADGRVSNLALRDERLELAVGKLPPGRHQEVGLRQHEQEKEGEAVPHRAGRPAWHLAALSTRVRGAGCGRHTTRPRRPAAC